MKLLIPTKSGLVPVFIDDEDYDLIKDFSWHIHQDRKSIYALYHTIENGKPVKKYMHRVILGAKLSSGVFVDHKDRNGLNNRKSNLRIASTKENSINVGLTIRNTTGYKGVYFYTKGHNKGRYTATTVVDGLKIFGGYFDTAEEAAKKYDELATAHHGDFAFLNFPIKNLEKEVDDEVVVIMVPKPKIGISGYAGVVKAYGTRYSSKIIVNGEIKYLGYFPNKEDAALAYNEASKKYYGELGYQNIIK